MLVNPGDPRDFDIVLLGATGFVGRLTAAHLAGSAGGQVRIGLAGRSAQRLRQTADELGPAAASWPLLTVDVTDESAVAALVRRTTVLVSTVGPYSRHGLPLVQACVGAGTHYADLTGETLFVRESIEHCHAAAVDSGAKIVHSCGFDSVPSDLGVGLTAAAAVEAGAGSLTDTVLRLRSGRGGVSGGTVDSLRQQLLQLRHDPALRRIVGDPQALAGDGASPGPGPSPARGWRDPASGRWQAPFVMGGYNRQVVLRSHALTDGGYGPDFGYREVVDTGAGPFGALAAGAVAVGSAAVVGGLSWSPTRRLLDAVLPKPGQGPSERVLRRGRFALDVEAATQTGPHYRTPRGGREGPWLRCHRRDAGRVSSQSRPGRPARAGRRTHPDGGAGRRLGRPAAPTRLHRQHRPGRVLRSSANRDVGLTQLQTDRMGDIDKETRS